jgi:uncharacterized protein
VTILPTIQEALDQIELTRGVRILLAVESGSRAWGFASPDSDYDVRFIYAGEIRRYLRVDPQRDVIELPIVDNLDVNGWDIVKALTLFRKSNPPLLEWLHSPIIYRERGMLARQLRELAAQCYSPRRMAYHYASMAKQSYLGTIAGRNEVIRKKYLYALRPLAAIYWLRTHTTPPPTSIHATLAEVAFPTEISTVLEELIRQKALGGELEAGPADQVLNRFLAAEIERVGEHLMELPDPEIDIERLNRLLWTELGLDHCELVANSCGGGGASLI